jgi:hypothetical protein
MNVMYQTILRPKMPLDKNIPEDNVKNIGSAYMATTEATIPEANTPYSPTEIEVHRNPYYKY